MRGDVQRGVGGREGLRADEVSADVHVGPRLTRGAVVGRENHHREERQQRNEERHRGRRRREERRERHTRRRSREVQWDNAEWSAGQLSGSSPVRRAGEEVEDAGV